MLRISNIKTELIYTEKDLKNAVRAKLKNPSLNIRNINIVKRSLDSRDHTDIHYSFILDVDIPNENAILHRFRKDNSVNKAVQNIYKIPVAGTEILKARPFIIGAGPAGLFTAYMLAEQGYKPVVVEQGEDAESRLKTVEGFFSGEKPLSCHSNIQFGMGGAGTFSDGKLSTGVKDPSGRNRKVLEIFVECGADPVILYDNKPHLGTDELVKIVKNMGEHIENLGGEIRFNTEFTGFTASENQLESVTLRNDKGTFTEPCNALILAIGHSARNTFYMLNDAGLNMEAKSFAVGVRAEHNQHDINNCLYGEDYERLYNVHLPAADYKLTYHAESGRSVYSFCMCPGGFVVNASSEEGRICVNGMSYKDRDSENANSAIIVSVNPEDTGGDTDPMNGIEFQRRLEEKAFEEGKGAVPYQLLKDFIALKPTEETGFVKPLIKGLHAPGNLNNVLPDYICNDIKEAFTDFGKKIKGFDYGDTVLSAVESRTSSPVRILRDENMESSVKGIMPIGEGAGYAGGIVSAAMDGLKAFEKICSKYSPVQEDTL